MVQGVKYKIRGWIEMQDDGWLQYHFQVNILEPVMDESLFTFVQFVSPERRTRNNQDDRKHVAAQIRKKHTALWERVHTRLDRYDEVRNGSIASYPRLFERFRIK